MSEKQVQIRVAFGAIVLKGKSATLATFKLQRDLERVSALQSGRSDPKTRSFLQSTTSKDYGKGFTQGNVAHDEGTIIQIQGRRTLGGVPTADQIMFMRLRADAPLYIIKLKLPLDPTSMLGDTMMAFTGRADILTFEEMRAMGYDIPRQTKSQYMDPEELDEVYEINEASPATGARPVFTQIATAKGVQVVEVAAPPERRIRIRR